MLQITIGDYFPKENMPLAVGGAEENNEENSPFKTEINATLLQLTGHKWC